MEASQYDRNLHGRELWTWWVQRDPLDYDCLDLLPMVEPGSTECHLGHGCVIFDDDGRPVLAGFAFMVIGVGIAFFERAISRPRTPLGVARAAGRMATDWLECYCKAQGYNLYFTHCKRESMARSMEKMGFVRSGGSMIELAKLVELD